MAEWPGANGGGGGFDYVQPAQPSEPQVGEEWYDSDASEAKVYDGSTWHKMTVGQHAELGGISSSDHHTRPTQTQSFSGELVTMSGYLGDGTTVFINQYAKFVEQVDTGDTYQTSSRVWYSDGNGNLVTKDLTAGQREYVYGFVHKMAGVGGNNYTGEYKAAIRDTRPHSHNI